MLQQVDFVVESTIAGKPNGVHSAFYASYFKLADMNIPAAQVYRLQLLSRAAYQATRVGHSRIGFHPPLTRPCPKLYVVVRGAQFHYVGITNRPMAARLNLGLKAKGKGGYHGYKWKHIRDPLGLLVWAFEHKSGAAFLRELETVEAEVAFLVRQTTGQWPLSQTEIHFYQPTSAHLQAAKDILQGAHGANVS